MSKKKLIPFGCSFFLIIASAAFCCDFKERDLSLKKVTEIAIKNASYSNQIRNTLANETKSLSL